VAEGDCITCSIGFRAPSHADILCELSQEIASTLSNEMRYSDAGLKLPANPGAVDQAAIARVRDIINAHFSDDNIAHWFGSYMTERKYTEAEPEDTETDIGDWQAQLARGALLWHHPAARFAYYHSDRGTQLFVDGQRLSCSLALAELLCRESELGQAQLQPALADERDREVMQLLINRESLLLDNDE
jgi:50S ribosomal protein L16 3-hydroxylase